MIAKSRFFTTSDSVNTPLAVGVKRFEEAIDVGHTKAYELIRNGEVESFTIGSKRLVVVSSIERLVEKLAKEAASKRAKAEPNTSCSEPTLPTVDGDTSASARLASRITNLTTQ